MQLNGKPMTDEMFEAFIINLDPEWKAKQEWHHQVVIHQTPLPYPLPKNNA